MKDPQANERIFHLGSLKADPQTSTNYLDEVTLGLKSLWEVDSDYHAKYKLLRAEKLLTARILHALNRIVGTKPTKDDLEVIQHSIKLLCEPYIDEKDLRRASRKLHRVGRSLIDYLFWKLFNFDFRGPLVISERDF